MYLKFMCCCLLLHLYGIYSQPTELPESFIVERCMNLHNVTDEQYAYLAENGSQPDDDPPMDIDKYMCFTHCILSETKLLDSNGKLDMAAIQAQEDLSDSEAEVIIQCKAEHDQLEEPCKYSFNVMLCVITNKTKSLDYD